MPNILLIEDTEDLGEMVKDILEIEGYAVRWARDGNIGMQYYDEMRPDLIITDVIMPNKNGLEVTKSVRLNSGAEVPIIILSAKASPEDQKAGYEAGATLYLKKPCSGSELVKSIKSILP